MDQIAEVSDSAAATNLTYLDVAGSIGTDLFYNTTNYVPGYYRPGEVLCRMFIADGVYNLPIESVTEWSVASDTSGTFLTSEITGTHMEINFIVKFTYNNQQYQALVGNISNGYIVLDIAKVNQNIPTTQSKSNTGVVQSQQETQARKTKTSAAPETSPAVSKAPTAPETSAPETSATPAPETSAVAPETSPVVPETTEPTVPKTSTAAPETNAHTEPANIENETIKGYEYQPGYVYIPGLGYLPDGGGGVNILGSDSFDINNPGEQIGH